MNDFAQQPVMFGPAASLLGMVTTPTGPRRLPVACLMLNMGANHRVGPHRINVKLAHEMARHGMASLRFDLGGLGDSGSSGSSEHFLTQAVRDLQSAMDLIEKILEIRQFVVVGLCSGAVNALSVAVADARVVGISMFDGYAFPERRSRWERAVRRAIAAPTNPAFIGKARRFVQRLLATATRSGEQTGTIFTESQTPEAKMSMFRRSMTQLADRGVAVQMLYSGTVHVRDRHRDQLGVLASDPSMRNVRYELNPDIDHSITTLKAQRLFVVRLTGWALEVAAERKAPADARMPEFGASPVVVATAPTAMRAPGIRARRPTALAH